MRYTNLDPETHVDPELLNQPGMQRRHVMSSNINQSTLPKSATILQTAQSVVSPTGITVLQNVSMSSGATQSIPTLSTMQSPITIPQMTRYVPIAPAPSAVPLVTQLATTNNISTQQITSSPIQIQIQPSLTNQTPQPTSNILTTGSVLGQPQRITINTEPIIAQTAGKDGKQMVIGQREQIMLLQPWGSKSSGGN